MLVAGSAMTHNIEVKQLENAKVDQGGTAKRGLMLKNAH